MATVRKGHTATLLSNGQVLVTGGVNQYGGTGYLSTAELYDPATNTWSAAGSMATARFYHTATLLNNGQVLVTGGLGFSGFLSQAELYNPISNTWLSAGAMASPRLYHTATLLSNGQVLVTGGETPYEPSPAGVAILSTCELYNPGPALDVAGFLSPTAVGVAGTFIVTAKNGDGTTNTSYAGTIHFTSSDAHAILPGDYTFTAADHGTHTFSATLKTAGAQFLIATDTTTRVAGFEAGINVWDPAVANPSLSTLSVAAATVFADGSTTVTLIARNDLGDPVTTGGLPFTFSATGGGFLSSASFSNLTDHHNGTYTATFTGSTAFGPAVFTISATLNGQSITTPLPTITVTPAVPATQLAITNLSAPNVTAGGSLTFTVTAEDSTGTPVPNYTGTIQLSSTDGRAALGSNGLPATYTFVGSDNGTRTFTVTLASAGSQTITVIDQANSTLTATTRPITVTAGSPKFVVSIPGSNMIASGSPFLFTVQATDPLGNPLTSYSGPTTITVAASPPDPQNNLPIIGTLNSSGFGLILGNLKTAGSYTLTATAGALTGTSSSITVAPADANHFAVTAPAAATTGSPVSVTVTALDPYGNVATNYGGKVHFTSSDAHGVLPADAALSGGVGVFSITLTSAGSQTITASDTVSTNPAIIGTSNAIVTQGLTVTSLAPTATGFTVTFSKPIVASDISLYGGTIANPIQNVTLIGKNSGPNFGPVNGTLVIDPTGTSATFKASSDWLENIAGQTNGLLPNGAYAVTLQSGVGAGPSANGFFDALGAPLDGAKDGGHANYVTTFTTANDGKPALTIPDFARGPDGSSTIKAPNDSANGIPVILANAPTGTKDIAFTLTYNPTLLTIANAGTGDASGAGSTFTIGSITNVDATHSQVTFTWHNSMGLSGVIVLGDILATVPNSAASLTLNDAVFTGVTAPAVHINAYFGDLSGDGQLTGLDLAMAGNVAAGAPKSPIGLPAYKLVDPGLIGDIGGNGSIDSAAISGLAGYLAHVATPALPTPPAGLTITPGGPDPTLSLGEPVGWPGLRYSDTPAQGLAAQAPSGASEYFGPGHAVSSPSAAVTVPVFLDAPRPEGSTGMTEAILGLTHDPKVLTVSAADIALGSIPAAGSGWRLEAVIDPVEGQIAIDLYSTTPISQAQAGSLVYITFHVVAGTRAPATTVQLVNSVTLLERSFSTEVADSEGPFVLSPDVDQLLIRTSERHDLVGQGCGRARLVHRCGSGR
jgi:hypothetical protein